MTRMAWTLAATMAAQLAWSGCGGEPERKRYAEPQLAEGAIPGRPDLGLDAPLNGMQIFPLHDPWNQPVDTAQVDPSSSAILARIGLETPLHPDFYADYNGGPYGMHYIVVPDETPRVPVLFEYESESDAGPYPIPPNPPVNGDARKGDDAHLIIITRDERKLYELFHFSSDGDGWKAGSGAIWDLVNGTQRPAGHTSADAAGLPIFAGLVRYEEVALGDIRHALRFTLTRTRRAYVPPANHWASASTDPTLPPMGMRIRLKASFDVSGFDTQAQVILRALQKYGMILADNGGNLFVTGTADARWDDGAVNSLKKVRLSDFEVVRMEKVVIP